MKYITIGPHCWGSDKNLDTSLQHCLIGCSSEYRVSPLTFNIFRVTDGTTVNEMGGFNFPANDPPPKQVEVRKIPLQILNDYWNALGDLGESSDRRDGLQTEVTYYG